MQQGLFASYLGLLLGWDKGERESLGCETDVVPFLLADVQGVT